MTDGVDPEIWVFLGDSLTEGVGSKCISYVSESMRMLSKRQHDQVYGIRFRMIGNDGLNKFGLFNFAGFLYEQKESAEKHCIWIWNLASEGTTIKSDRNLVELIRCLRPARIFLLRGALESIVRPSHVARGNWPIWIPRSWRHYAAMDPRCYFSDSWWRRAKQKLIDYLKQRVRLKLLENGGSPMLTCREFADALDGLLEELTKIESEILVLALPPVSENRFPNSLAVFRRRNELLRSAADRRGVQFFDWHYAIESAQKERALFYLDGFHPNEAGSQFMASLLLRHLGLAVTCPTSNSLKPL